MDDFSDIPDLANKKFVCSGEQLKKIVTPEGCQINIVEDFGASTIHDDSLSDDDLENDDTPNYLDRVNILENSKREYISLSLNSNRDPTKLRSKLADIIGDEDDIKCDDFSSDIDSSVNYYHKIHKRYSKNTNFETMLSDTEAPFDDISEGKVLKRCLIPGVGIKVDRDTLVIYNLALWAENSRDPFDSTWLRRNTIVTDMSQDSILPGINDLLLSCRKGEWCEGLIRPEAAFGKLGVRPRIPPNATIFCLLEVVKIVKKDKISWLTMNHEDARQFGITFDDFWQASDEARKRGNHYYTVKNYRAANQRYKSGIRILETLTYKNAEEEEAAKGLLLKLYNNLAKSTNAAGEPRMALYACKQASLLVQHDCKTYWNRMIAWKKRGHYERALAVANLALKYVVEPSNQKHFRREARELEAIIENDQSSLTELYRLMGRYVSCP